MPFTAVHIANMDINNPASIDISTGHLYLNGNTFFALPTETKKQILLHELAHHRLGTMCEFTADEWAFNQYIKHGGSPKASIKAISNTLDGTNPQQFERLNKRIEMAKIADKYISARKANYTGEQISPEDQARLQQLRQLDKELILIEAEERTLNIGITAEERTIATVKAEIAVLVDIEVQNTRLIALECDRLNNNKRQRDCYDKYTSIIRDAQRQILGLREEFRAQEEKLKARLARKAILTDAKAYKKRMVGNALVELAKNCIDGRSQLSGQILGGIGNITAQVGGMVSGAPVAAGSQPAMMSGCQNPIIPPIFNKNNDATGSSNTIIIIVILVFAAAMYMILKRKK